MEADEGVKKDEVEELSTFQLPTEIPGEMDVAVVNLGSVMYEGKAKTIIATSPGGNVAILPGHTPLFTKLDKGTLIIDNGKGQKEIDIDGGVAKITQNKVTILVGF